jgi:hypothetical protein
MMSPTEQEALFKTLQTIYPHWQPQFCSGYVHGAADEGRRKFPQPLFLDAEDDYEIGYLLGFAIHRGVDAEVEPWFSKIADRLVEATREAPPQTDPA